MPTVDESYARALASPNDSEALDNYLTEVEDELARIHPLVEGQP